MPLSVTLNISSFQVIPRGLDHSSMCAPFRVHEILSVIRSEIFQIAPFQVFNASICSPHIAEDNCVRHEYIT